jgi:hypothetical protein
MRAAGRATGIISIKDLADLSFSLEDTGGKKVHSDMSGQFIFASLDIASIAMFLLCEPMSAVHGKV